MRSRIIPARAGPTNCNIEINAFLTDHPRSCGANQKLYSVVYYHPGSSPLVRGQQPFCSFRACLVRIIPARAGPTRCRVEFLTVSEDHPRSCGANEFSLPQVGVSYGSSPLVRGQPCRRIPFAYPIRIIPARAGPTAISKPLRNPDADHPRSCGANLCRAANSARQSGSSPLVRGQPLRHRTRCLS